MKKILSILLILALMVCVGTACAAEYQLHQPSIGAVAGYILTDGETVLLIDCGTNTDIETRNEKLFTYLAASGLKHIDYYIVTHYHNDHCYNLNELLTLYGDETTQVYGCTETLIEELSPMATGVYNQMKIGDDIQMGPYQVHCVGPEEVRVTGHINADSLNFVITAGGQRMFFGGDHVSGAVLNDHGDEIENCAIVGFPHHGLKPLQLSGQALKRMNPSVILVPGGPEGHINYFAFRSGVKAKSYGIGAGSTVVLFGDDRELEVVDHCEPGQFQVQ